MKRTIYFLLLVVAATGAPAAKALAQSGACAPSGGLNFICGLQAPEDLYIRFYGSSFIADPQGAKVAEANESDEAVLLAEFDLAQVAELRDNWFVFRDRRPELYGALATFDGQESAAFCRR